MKGATWLEGMLGNLKGVIIRKDVPISKKNCANLLCCSIASVRWGYSSTGATMEHKQLGGCTVTRWEVHIQNRPLSHLKTFHFIIPCVKRTRKTTQVFMGILMCFF
jgi:hypothetical protein